MNENEQKKQRWSFPLKLISVLLAVSLLLSLASPSIASLVSAAAEGSIELTESEAPAAPVEDVPEMAPYGQYLELADTAIKAEDYEQAAIELEKAIELASEESPYLLAQLLLKSASVQILTGHTEKAQQLLDECLKLDPSSSQALLLRAQMAIDRADATAAVEDLKVYMELVPEDTDTGLAFAQMLEIIGDYPQAAKQYEALYQMRSEEESHLLNSIRCQFLSGEYEAALARFEQYTAEAPGDSAYYATALFLKGACLLQLGYAAEATEAFSLARENGYDSVACDEQLMLCYFETEDYQAAVECGDRLLATEAQLSSPAMFYQRMGASLVLLERYEQALEYLDMLDEFQEHIPGGFYYRGVSYLALGRYEEAISAFDASIGEQFLLQFCYYNRGVCHVQLLDYEKALEDMEMTLSSGEDQTLIQAAENIIQQLTAYFEAVEAAGTEDSEL